jgi:hypothetical protein
MSSRGSIRFSGWGSLGSMAPWMGLPEVNEVPWMGSLGSMAPWLGLPGWAHWGLALRTAAAL